MRVSTVFGATLAVLATLWGITAPSTSSLELVKAAVTFKKPLDLISTTTTYNETDAWGARYYFTVFLPENAGESLERVTIQQRQGFENIQFRLQDTQAFEGTPGNKGARFPLKAVTKDPQSPTISVTFNPPVPPGKTVTIELHPVRNPSVGGVYIFGVTAFPAVENPYGLYLGVGRLQFYESHPFWLFH